MLRRTSWPLAGLLCLAACSAPPDKERHQAEGAIAAAREAGAAEYAAADLKTAETALEQYNAAVAQRDYRQALALAVEARDTAYQAARRSADGKAAARSEADRLAADVTRLLQVARARLAAPNARGAAGTRLHALVADADRALQEARSAIAKQTYADAVSKLSPIDAALRAELEPAPLPASHRTK